MTDTYRLYDNDEPMSLKDLTETSNFRRLSLHRNLTFEWILKFPNANWDFKALTHRYNFTKSWFFAYPDKPWDITKFSSIYNLTLKDLLKIDNCENILDFRALSQNKNIDYDWLELFPNENWDLDALAVHPNFTFDWLNLIDPQKWNFEKMSHNKKLSWSIVEKLKEEKWDFRALSHNENLNMHWYQKFKTKDWDYQVLYDRFISTTSGRGDAWNRKQVNEWVMNLPTNKLNYEKLSTHKYLNLSWIDKHKSGNWNFAKISYFTPCGKQSENKYLNKKWFVRHPNETWDPNGLIEQPLFDITWLLLLPKLNWDIKKITYSIHEILLEHIIRFPKFLTHKNWFGTHPYLTKNWLEFIIDTGDVYLQLSKNKNINCEWILKKPEANWDFKSLSYKCNLALDTFQQFQDKPWDYTGLSKNPNMDIQIVKEYPERPWDFCALSYNYHIDLDVLQQFPEQEWNFSVLSSSYNLNFSWLQAFPKKSWCFTELSRNTHLTVDWLRTLPDKPWDFKHLSSNKNLTLEWINAIPKAEWHGNLLSLNRNFRLDWYQTYPDGNWDYEILANRSKVKHLIVDFQKKCTCHPLLQTYWDMDNLNLNIQILVCLVLLNKDNFPYLSLVNQQNPLLRDAFHHGTQLSEEERQNVVKVRRLKIKVHTLYPEMFLNLSIPLLLTDLSGDKFEVPGWFQARNLMRHIHNTLPELGKIDIYIESFTDKPDQLGSQSYTKHLKYLLFNNPHGPQAMIVYPEL